MRQKRNGIVSLAVAVCIAIAGCFVLLSGGCSKKAERNAGLSVGVVMDVGGREDKGKNALIWRGCQRVIEELDVEIEYREPASESEFNEALEELLCEGVGLLIVAAAPSETIVLKYAAENPDVDFVVIDGTEGADNVLALTFAYEDAGYVAGAAAAAYFPAGAFGFIGGREDAPTLELSKGFSQALVDFGSKKPDVAFLGDGFEAPADIEKAVAEAERMYGAGADIVFAAAGRSNVDILAVALEKRRYAIGYESNQNWIEPGWVFLSVSRRTDEVIYDIMLDKYGGRFDGGVREYNIGDDVFEFPIDEENQALYDKDVVARIETVRSELAAGKRQPP
ncbi:MAG: BMP family ABC transporter substrate-binding protein [Candidatus Coatesbacteria bacterium]|nr:MAG: BMP family ABC transporter substrate-binding protein [Candidatus Coatesbacteria bacterium]